MKFPALEMDTVISDDFESALAVTQQLLDAGHKRLAFVTATLQKEAGPRDDLHIPDILCRPPY